MTDPGGRRWRLVRARRDAVPSSVRRFTERARQRRLRAALPWAVGATVLALAGLFAWFAYNTSILGVREIRVNGTVVLSADEVRAAVAVEADTPLIRVDLGRVRHRVAALPPVDRVTVTREWPNTLLVEIQERVAVAVVPKAGRFLLMDGTGVAYHTVAERPARLPIVRLAKPDPADLSTRSALRVLAVLTDELREQLVELVVAGPAGISLKLREGRQVIWGDATENEEKAKVATVLLEREGRTFDVTAPGVVTIR